MPPLGRRSRGPGPPLWRKRAHLSERHVVKHASLLLGLLALGGMAAGVPADQSPGAQYRYVGVERCRACHDTRRTGRQYQVWKRSPHANAYETLAGSRADRIAQSLDVEDPHKNAACLECHVTAFGVGPERLARKFTIGDGVGCEACHGPGEVYATSGMMRAVASGTQDAAEIGLISQPPEAVCVSCHNDRSPTYKPFHHADAVARIAHPRPVTNSP